MVTKDKDFQQLCALRGAPPKVVWLRLGNGSTAFVAELLIANAAAIREFSQQDGSSLLILTLGG